MWEITRDLIVSARTNFCIYLFIFSKFSRTARYRDRHVLYGTCDVA
jgi:hypothetical protein